MAAIGPEIDPHIGPLSDGSPAGTFSYDFVLGFALIGGWALGAGVEAAWKEDPEGSLDEPWMRFVLAVVLRLMAGLLVFFIVIFAALGLEELGVGFG